MKRIIKAKLGEKMECVTPSHGDIWSTTWADDGYMYSVSDDTFGFDHSCNSNIAIHKLSGDLPQDIRGITINPMEEYGKSGELLEDLANWKAQGLTCVDGVLYMAVSRHGYAIQEPYLPYPVQEAWDASIIKSEDKGITWSSIPVLGQAMFPGRTFSTPYFVEYGQNGKGGDDESEAYVYAVSNDGSWNNGNYMTMGRVRKEKIGLLDANDWEFVHNFTYHQEPIWRPGHLQARYVFRAPGRTSMTGIHYVKGLQQYIMPQWHYYKLDDTNIPWWDRFRGTRLEFYSAPKPWGPWTLFHYEDFWESWYNPVLPSKLMSKDGKTLWMFVSGGDWLESPYYKLWMLPLHLELEGK